MARKRSNARRDTSKKTKHPGPGAGTPWTKASIREFILDRQRRGKPVNHGAVHRLGGASGAAMRIFGSWDQALQYARIDPAKVRQTRVWTRNRVLQAIRKDRKAGRSLSSVGVRHRDAGLLSSALRHFGKWSDAIRAAGIKPETILHRQPWTRKRIIQAIKKLQPTVRRVEVEPENHGLVRAGVIEFGTWPDAVRAAGRTYPTRNVPTRWTHDAIAKAIRQQVKRGLSIKTGAVCDEDSPLYQAGRRWFGTWKKTLRPLGFSYA